MESEKVSQSPDCEGDCTIRLFSYACLVLQNELTENGSVTNASHTDPTDKVQVLARRKDPTADNKTKKIRRLTLRLEEIERER